jgi:hypothetical protein
MIFGFWLPRGQTSAVCDGARSVIGTAVTPGCRCCSRKLGTDRRDWDALASVLGDTVDLDYSSLSGDEPARLAAADLIEAWRKSLGGFDATQHLLGSFLVDVVGPDEARVRFYGQATHVLDTPRGDRTRTVAAHYEATARDRDGWRVTALTLHLDWAAGNQQLAALAAGRGPA